MPFYIGCIKPGQNANLPVDAGRFQNKLEFVHYINEINMMRDTYVDCDMTIEDLCDALQDVGFGGIGSRYYRRIPRAEALKILRF